MTYGDAKDNLSGLFHGGDIDDIEGVDLIFERSANTLLSKIDPIDTMRTMALTQTIHDDVYNVSLPSDFKEIVDLYPQDNRNSGDTAGSRLAEAFDLKRMFRNKEISIEGSEGSKVLRVNWRSRQGKVLNTMDSLTANGTWSAIGSATGLQANTIFKVSGSASIEFDLVVSGDGIQNTTMSQVDLTNEDQVADIFVWVYLPSAPTSISAKWGNDLTTKYWTSTAQTTQAEGTAFKVGWNLIKFSWASATETGTVVPSQIDSFQITVANSVAMANIRIDNIIFSIGRNFDIKYYSKYLFKNTAGTFISRPTTDSDIITLDNDAIQIMHLENLIALSQQVESEASGNDISWAKEELDGRVARNGRMIEGGLYQKYRKKYPSQAKKVVGFYGSKPARGRW